ncbi:MAG: ankyrin repeat domain-containing protein [Planctomycetaceae bacterium]|nr:ankyrin repeat domain-containing protein [Planctomycetaceae bacterium]
MFNAKNKLLIFMVLCAVVALIMAIGCSDEDKKNATILSDAIRSRIAQIEHSQSLYQRPDWKAEDFFDDPKVIALCQAIRKRDLVLIEKLIGEGADVNAKGKGNMTPLLWAFVQGRPWNKPPSQSNRNKPGFLEKWSEKEFDVTHLVIFTKLLEHGADPNVQITSDFGWLREFDISITEYAALVAFPYFEAVMKNGGNPNYISQSSQNAHKSLAHLIMGRVDSIKKLQLLIDSGVDLNQVNDEGMTPLMLAVSNGSYDQALMLVEAGADWLIASRESPDYLAHIVVALIRQDVQTPSYLKLIEILEEKGADFDLEREIRRHSRGSEERARLQQQRRELYERIQQERMQQETAK